MTRDSRLTTIIMWIAGVASVLTAAGAIAILTKFFQMSDTLIRVETKVSASNELQVLQFSQMDRRMGALEGRVGSIEQRQIDAQNLRARP